MKSWQILTIAGGIFGCFLLWYFDPKGRFDAPVSSSDTTIINLPPVSISLPPSASPTIIYQQLPTKIDSGAVIRDYFATRNYRDSLENDTVKIVLNEAIGQNKVISRNLQYTLKLPITTVVNQSVEEKRRKLLLGGFASVDSLGSSLFAGAAYQNKNNQLFLAGYNPISKRGIIGVMLPVSLRRK